jgi:exopolysaccharide biosynthesis polyprenyl glycosylphosphotransferase
MKEDAAALTCDSRAISSPQPSLFLAADTTRFFGLQARLKRLMDILIAMGLLAVTSPLFLIVALLIKRSGPGPVFFVQERLGRDGQPFLFYKFRTMEHNSDDAIHRQFAAMFINGDEEGCRKSNGDRKIFKMSQDPRVTQIGAWLRRTSLDELPQIFNVLRGDMSLVGPRPPIVYEIEHYQPWHMERLKVTPGLTGLWQVSGRSSVPFEEMVRLDVHYINHWSLWMDLRILLKTVPVVLQGTGGY